VVLNEIYYDLFGINHRWTGYDVVEITNADYSLSHTLGVEREAESKEAKTIALNQDLS
jgi:hypothetical protein